MAEKEINIARIAVDMVANTSTYATQLKGAIKVTDKSLKDIEQSNKKSNSNLSKEDKKAAKEAERTARQKADAEIEQEKRAARETAAIARQKGKDQQTHQ